MTSSFEILRASSICFFSDSFGNTYASLDALVRNHFPSRTAGSEACDEGSQATTTPPAGGAAEDAEDACCEGAASASRRTGLGSSDARHVRRRRAGGESD